MATRREHSSGNSTAALFVCVGLVCIGIGFLIGWTAKGDGASQARQNAIAALRVDGYKFTKPLLACDTEYELSSPKHASLETELGNLVRSEVEKGAVTTASVYVRDYNGGYSVNINPDEKYYPASLGKVPLMMTAYEMAQGNTGFLEEKHLYEDTTDHNTVEIKPSDYLKPGQNYSLKEAMDKLIINSDNNAFYWLTQFVDSQKYTNVFQELDIPFRDKNDPNASQDYMTAKSFSYFLRVLYNSTFIDRDLSEKMLETLSKVEYSRGLVAGLPKGMTIAHKFGIKTDGTGNSLSRELHDCGVVYPGGKEPYLICVMTKGQSTLENQENMIKEISETTYERLRK